MRQDKRIRGVLGEGFARGRKEVKKGWKKGPTVETLGGYFEGGKSDKVGAGRWNIIHKKKSVG